jgi:hypothetical protein
MDTLESKLRVTFQFSEDGRNIEDTVLSAPSEETEKVLRGIVSRFVKSHINFLEMSEERIPYGLDRDYPCNACGAKPGEYHKDMCDMERCPTCRRQYISCGCQK